MNKDTLYRFLRYNWISKMMFKIEYLDYFFRKFFIRKLYDNEKYSSTSKNIININNELNPILKKYNGFLGHGIALCLIRDNKLPEYQDLDYDIYDCSNIDSLIYDMAKIGYDVTLKGILEKEIKQLQFTKNNYQIDFFMCNVINKQFQVGTVTCEKIFPKYEIIDNWNKSHDYICYLRNMTFTPIEERILLNSKFYLPKNYNQYFTEMYGGDWTIPKKYFNWVLHPKNNKPIIKKNNVEVFRK